MNKEYNIQFFETIEEAFNYQNIQGGTLYISGKDSKTQYEYDIAHYIAEAPEEETRRFIVVDDYIREIIERPCFNLKGRGRSNESI